MMYVPINILHTFYVMSFNPLNSMRQVLLPTRPQSCRRRLRLRGMTLLPAVVLVVLGGATVSPRSG